LISLKFLSFLKNVVRTSNWIINVLSACLIISACDKKADPEVLVCFVSTRVSNGTSYSYTYENEKLTTINLSQGTYKTTYKISDNDQGNIFKVTYEAGDYDKFTYDANHNLLFKEYFHADGVLYSLTAFEYNNFGQRIKMQIYGNSKAGSPFNVKGSYEVLEYSNNVTKNPVKFKGYSSLDVPTFVAELTYDDKKPVYNRINSFIDLSGFYGLVENNVTKEIVYFPDGSLFDTAVWTYEYNDFGYPTKATVISHNGTTTETYEYDCK
jgi:hypothetical protein